MQLKCDMYQHRRREVQSSMFQAPGTHFFRQQIQTLCLTTGAAPQGFCNRYLMQALPPQRTRPITMLTSNFSHSSLLHLGVNMVAFWGFGNVVARVRRPHAAAVHARVAGSRPVSDAVTPVLITSITFKWLPQTCAGVWLRSQVVLSCISSAGAGRRAVPGLLYISRHGVFGGVSPPLHQTTQTKIYQMLIAALLASIHRALR